MSKYTLQQPTWRIEIYSIKDKDVNGGFLTDISTIYTTELQIKKQRNYPDEISFTVDLVQLQERAKALGLDPRSVIEPYRHNVKVFRNNKFVSQAIVTKTSVNLNNQGKNTVEISCVDILGIFEKRLIHQDYAIGSWAEFAAKVVMDAQHEPNRIYNYAWEGDGTGTDNAWFRGWKYTPPAALLQTYPEWKPNGTYQMYDKITYAGKFWEANKTHIADDSFSESYWEPLAIVDGDNPDNLIPIYGVWREDEEEAGPTGTHEGGWGGTSSCHLTGKTYSYTSPQSGTISLAGSSVSTTLVAPFPSEFGRLYMRVMALPMETTYLSFYEEFADGSKVHSPAYELLGNWKWQEVSYTFPQANADVTRVGFTINGGETLLDSPVCYKEQLDNDEWDLGVRVGVFPTHEEQAEAGWRFDRFTSKFEWKNAKQTLYDLSNMDSDNFWYMVDENYNINFYINAGEPDVRLDLSYPRNITSMTVDTNAKDIVNYVKGDGSSEVKQDPLVSGVENTNAAPFTWIGYNRPAMQDYWALASAESFNSERTIENLRDDINSTINTYSNILDVPLIKVQNGTISPEDIDLGDIVSVVALDNPYVQRINGLYKIIATQINIDVNDVENITLTLIVPTANQLNALAFPQIIKNLILRVQQSR